MREKTPQDYANELIKLYRENTKALNNSQISNTPSTNTPFVFEDGTGGIQVKVTTLSRLYPVSNALVTIFVGTGNDVAVIETDVTDSSGKTGVFNLKTPPKSESEQADSSTENPYSQYNISVKSDGYVEQIAMNVPVFSGVVSVQNMDLLPISAAGSHTNPQIFDEDNKYNL